MTTATSTPEPYSIEYRTIGWLKPERVLVAYMPRADFLGILDQTVNEVSDDADDRKRVHEIVDPVAATMERFAMGDWIDDNRGCGCLVGETLIAGQHVEFLEQSDFDPNRAARAQAVAKYNGQFEGFTSAGVDAMLKEFYSKDEAALLFELGNLIDENIFDSLVAKVADLNDDGVTEDGERIESVIFIDG